jgi:hypothetical protein
MSPLLSLSMLATVVIPDPTVDPIAFITQLFGAGRSGAWAVVATLLLVGLVAIVRKFGGKLVEKLAGDRAGAILGFLSGFAPALAAAVLAGPVGVLSYVDAIGQAIVAGCAVAGLYVVPKKILKPSDATPAPVETPSSQS